MSLPQPPLLVVTDRRQARAPLIDILEAACAAGCRWISLREKDLPADDQIALASALSSVAERYQARLTLHGDPQLAKLAGLQGVHLAAGANAATARAIVGSKALIGISVHRSQEARALAPQLVDYAIAGPAYPSASKAGYGPALGAAGVAEIVRASRVPVLAIGGISAACVAELMGAGAGGVGVMGSVMRAEKPFATVRALLSVLAEALARRCGSNLA